MIVFLAGCLQTAVLAQIPTFQWAQSAGSSGFEGSYAVTSDALGNIIHTGAFSNSVDFDPGLGQTILQASGNSRDIFVQKVDPSGQLLWAVSFPGLDNNYPDAITTDTAGNVYVAASFRNTIDCDPGPGINNLTASGSTDALVVKLDPNGNLQWARSVGGSGLDRGYSVEVDSNQRVYFSGYFQGTADLDPGPATQSHSVSGSADVFTIQLDQNGDLIWARSFGGPDNDIPLHSALDQTTGDLYITGNFGGTADHDPGPGVFNITSQGANDIFVTKLDSAGNFLWSKTMGGTSDDYGHAIGVDAAGDVLVSGRYSATVDLDPGIAVSNYTSNGFTDVFLVKLSAAGNHIWSRTFGSSLIDRLFDLEVDLVGNVYLSGAYYGTCDFDPGPGVYNLTSNGLQDVSAVKFDPNGQFEWAISFGGTDLDSGFGVSTDLFGGVIISGYFRSNVDFDPGTTTYLLNSAGSWDAFLMKLGGCQPSFSNDNVVSCGSYVWIDSNTYSMNTDSAVYILTNQYGCDSVVTLHLTVHPLQSSTDTVTACGTYTWIDGVTYTANTDSATTTFTNQNGCDSNLTLHLTIHPLQSSTDTVFACSTYTWINGVTYTANTDSATITFTDQNGCDSLVTLNLNLNQPVFTTTTVSACESYIWTDGTTYTASTDSAKQVLVGANGCDSVVTLDLTIVNLDPELTVTDTSIVASDSTAIYQWLDCDNGYQPIPGANNQEFEPQESGTYAVEISRDGCVDTSACVFINPVGIARPQQFTRRVFPNPNTGRFAIEFGSEKASRITITNIAGQVVLEQNVRQEQVQWIYLNAPAGLYFLHIQSKTGLVEQKTMVISPQ